MKHLNNKYDLKKKQLLISLIGLLKLTVIFISSSIIKHTNFVRCYNHPDR